MFGESLHGVGSVSGLKNQKLAETVADNRAKAEVYKVLTVELKTRLKQMNIGEAEAQSRANSLQKSLS